MSQDKPRPRATKQSDPTGQGPSPAGSRPAKPQTSSPIRVFVGKRSPLFRRVDWLTFAIATLITLAGYLYTLAPDLTLEDCGELAVASYYAGVPHAPGYPVWTIYTWLFTVLLPFSNIAWRVAVSSAVAAALANGLLGLIVSRGSSMILEGIQDLKGIERRWENGLCLVSGIVAAMLIGFNGFMWSQAIIVEVYTLSVLSLMGVLVCLLHWIYAPNRTRYLYVAAFLFGICFNNHQTLIVAAIGLEVAIAVARPKLGRDAFFANVVFYFAGLALNALGVMSTFQQNVPLFVVFNIVGISSLAVCVYLTVKTGGLLSEWRTVLITMMVWLAGVAFYLYMPLASATNPPMNWAYPRTFDGFIHAFTRGQYEKTNPTNLLSDPLRFFFQLKMYFEGAIDEFNLTYLLLAAVPFFFIGRMQQRERSWILGNTAIYACLAFILLILLNPNTDRQSRDLTKVFFTASHVTLAMFVGHGLSLVGAMMIVRYQQYRTWALYGAAIGTAVALYALAAKVQDAYGNPAAGTAGAWLFFKGLVTALRQAHFFTPPVYSIYAAVIVFLWSITVLGIVLLHRKHLPPVFLLAAFAVIPVSPLVSHWAENEQRGHRFGFWFGHDMFTPPFGIYPEMTRDAILFGGTDPGRFCPTYMIFCESFIKPTQRFDPDFDRRDVYVITQNALADATYLNYIRAHYNRSTQLDPPFLHDFVMYLQSIAMGRKEADKRLAGQPYRLNPVAKTIGSLTNLVAPFDRLIINGGKWVEDGRRRRGVYPPNEILTPTPEDSQACFAEYITDAQRRLFHDTQYPNEPKELRPGELVNFTPDGRVQVAGQVAVMAINGLLTKVIFDKNPTNEFFIEESFPLEWMYPYLTPYGVIMKINRKPVPEITGEMLRRDHEFWTKYSARLCGDWITYDTPIKDICEFADRVYRKGDLTGYSGDPKFVRDDDAQKAFSKLRNSIAGLYAWRISQTQNSEERNRLIREADFAFKQAFAFCPYSPETVTRYATLLVGIGRTDDALVVAEAAQRLDEESPFAQSVIDQIRGVRQNMAALAQAQNQIGQLEQQYRTNTNSIQAAFSLVSAYLQLQQTGPAFQVLDEIMLRPNADASILLSVANAYVQLGQYGRVEPALVRLAALMPDSPEIWYDLAGAQTAIGKTNEALQSLAVALGLNQRRLAADPSASNLLPLAASDARFLNLRAHPQFRELLTHGQSAPQSILESPSQKR